MHTVTPFQIEYRATNRNREFWTYRTVPDALKALQKACWRSGYLFLGEFVSDRFDSYSTIATCNGLSRIKVEAQFIITDQFGEAISLETLKELDRTLRSKKYKKSPNKGAFRQGGWPHIHCSRRHRGSWSRLITTTQEKTWASADNDDFAEIGWHPAKAGRTRDLPSARDGIHKYRGRCWKKYRAHQWR